MPWYHSDGTNRFGPLTDEQFAELVRNGTVRGTTLVWRDGMPQWEMLERIDGAWSGLSTAGVAPVAAGTGRRPCAGCGQMFAADDLVTIEGAAVCAACKPGFLQRLREGAPVSLVADSTGMFHMGKHLVVETGAVPPNRCVCCNQPGAWRRRRRYYWMPPWVYLTLLCNLIVFAVVGMMVRKTMYLDVVLCAEHAARRQKHIVVAWGLFVASLGGFALAITSLLGVVGPAGNAALMFQAALWISSGVLLVASAVVGIRAASVLSPRKIGNRTAKFSRAGSGFLAGLPPWNSDIV